jgi:hypothetical protein
MDTGSDKPRTFGVLASLKQEGEGYRLILDDLEGMEREGDWRKISLITWKDYPKEKIHELSLDDKELADFGRIVLIRLMAQAHPATPDVVDEADIRWGKEIQLDISKEGVKKRIALRLSEPIASVRHEDFFCLVSFEGLFNSYKRAYGFDAAQARELSFGLVRAVLQDYEIRSPDGQLVSIGNLLA